MLKEFVQVRKNIGEKKVNFEEWKSTNVSAEQNMNKLMERNRKLIAMKWLQKKVSKLEKIQKKKAGLKRQKLLELKAQRMKR